MKDDTSPLLFWDHRKQTQKVTNAILVAVSAISVLVTFGVSYIILMENESNLFLLLFILPGSLAFGLLPFLIIFIAQKKNKKIEFQRSLKKIYIYEGKVCKNELSYHQIQSIKQSRYTYVVKNKNSSRTVTVFTVVAPDCMDQILAESLDIFQIRQFAETIAKELRVDIQTESGEVRKFSDLDLPLHERIPEDSDLATRPSFPKESYLSWTETKDSLSIVSQYKPTLFLFLAALLSFILFVFFQLLISDVWEVSFFSWSGFPPTLSESIYLALCFLLLAGPSGYVLYQFRRKKEWTFGKERITIGNKQVFYKDLEELLLEPPHLIFVGDKSVLKLSLHFFTPLPYQTDLKKAILFAIQSKARETSDSFRGFQTEF